MALYPAIAGGTQAALSSAIKASDTTISISGKNALPDGPNLAVISSGSMFETILYTAITRSATADTAVLSGCTRAIEGTARNWTSGCAVSRNLTAYDWNNLLQNMSDLNGKKIYNSSGDWNNITQDGYHLVTMGSMSAHVAPIADHAGTCCVCVAHNGTTIVQQCQYGASISTRSYNGTVWTDWDSFDLSVFASIPSMSIVSSSDFFASFTQNMPSGYYVVTTGSTVTNKPFQNGNAYILCQLTVTQSGSRYVLTAQDAGKFAVSIGSNTSGSTAITWSAWTVVDLIDTYKTVAATIHNVDAATDWDTLVTPGYYLCAISSATPHIPSVGVSSGSLCLSISGDPSISLSQTVQFGSSIYYRVFADSSWGGWAEKTLM